MSGNKNRTVRHFWQPVTSDYTLPFRFGTIKRVLVDGSGEHVVDHGSGMRVLLEAMSVVRD